jgi:tRNA G18 (ribose-2'-O)-methylase SpoU
VKNLILHNIRSAYNIGAIFRTADGVGVSKIFLTGYSPRPTDRFGRTQPEIKKTSLGASETMEWEAMNDIEYVIHRQKQEGYVVIAIEQSSQSQPLFEYNPPENVTYILGNETEGIEEEILKASDLVLEIPMLGHKESLNVSVAAGIVMYSDLLLRKKKNSK